MKLFLAMVATVLFTAAGAVGQQYPAQQDQYPQTQSGMLVDLGRKSSAHIQKVRSLVPYTQQSEDQLGLLG